MYKQVRVDRPLLPHPNKNPAKKMPIQATIAFELLVMRALFRKMYTIAHSGFCLEKRAARRRFSEEIVLGMLSRGFALASHRACILASKNAGRTCRGFRRSGLLL